MKRVETGHKKWRKYMFGLETLDVLIGLVTIYLSFGIACTAFVEAISSWMGLRSKNLKDGMHEFFQGSITGPDGKAKTFADEFYNHPLIQTLSKGKDGRPSYIPTKIVGQVVESMLGFNEQAEGLKEVLEALPGENAVENRIKYLLLEFYSQVKGDVTEFRQAVENHFDASMERVVGWFKRQTQFVAFMVSAVLVLFANADTVEIAHSLASNPEARGMMVQVAGKLVEERKAIEANLETQKSKLPETAFEAAKKKTKAADEAYSRAISDLGSTGLKLGWKELPNTAGGWFSKIAGLLVSILAVSLGAPFWFQVLQRFIQVRGAGARSNTK